MSVSPKLLYNPCLWDLAYISLKLHVFLKLKQVCSLSQHFNFKVKVCMRCKCIVKSYSTSGQACDTLAMKKKRNYKFSYLYFGLQFHFGIIQKKNEKKKLWFFCKGGTYEYCYHYLSLYLYVQSKYLDFMMFISEVKFCLEFDGL